MRRGRAVGPAVLLASRILTAHLAIALYSLLNDSRLISPTPGQPRQQRFQSKRIMLRAGCETTPA